MHNFLHFQLTGLWGLLKPDFLSCMLLSVKYCPGPGRPSALTFLCAPRLVLWSDPGPCARLAERIRLTGVRRRWSACIDKLIQLQAVLEVSCKQANQERQIAELRLLMVGTAVQMFSCVLATNFSAPEIIFHASTAWVSLTEAMLLLAS